MHALAELLGQSPGIAAVREKLRQLLAHAHPTRRLPPVLLQGETGTGKGLFASVIHGEGPRRSGPFVDVNCAAIPETLLEAELFGFERGAFTDARRAKAGLFQTAHGGTLFLDEIGLMPEALQAKLLNVIEERSVRRLGSVRNEPVDVWIIAASNEDLGEAVRARRFRVDLYHRLAVLTLVLPPLRERENDILLLAEHFLARATAEYGLRPKKLAPDARAALLAYRWPGNIRELGNVMERVALLAETSVVTAEMLGLPDAAASESSGAPHETERVPLDNIVETIERKHLLEALEQTKWNVSQAAAGLGITRNMLRYRIDRYGLRPSGVSPRPSPERRPKFMAPAAGRPAAAGPVPVQWERRLLALLHAVLTPPDEQDVLVESNRQVELLVEKVENFGGRVEEFSATAIVAVFGLERIEDAPSRAALAAMAMLKATARARRLDTVGAAIRVGLHAGQFNVGQVDDGAPIDLDAKREASEILEALVECATADTIVVSDAARSLLERRFEFAPAVAESERGPGPREWGTERRAGAPSPSAAAYRLTGYQPTRFGIGGHVARFVGRQHELELLRDRFVSALGGKGQVVGIVGEAGIGKSRLLFEFRQNIRGERVVYREGRCESYSSGIPYFPLIGMLRRNFRLSETDGADVIREKVRWSLDRLGLESEEAAPYLLELLGIKEGTERLALLSPEAIQTRTFEIFLEMSLKGSRQQPLVFAIENLHWIDKASETYCASLVERLAGAPILLIMTYRPGYRLSWTEKSYVTQIALQPLAPEDSRTVVQSIWRTEPVPEPVARLIVAHAEGNPFFLEELARAMREHRDPTSIAAVPGTIQEVLQARIDRLVNGPKQLLQTASIMGREVSLRLLAAIVPEPRLMDQHLSELRRLEFLYERGGADEPVYVFKHALTQEVAYATVPELQREALHAAAGRALESLYAGRLEVAYDRLAYHYARTQDAAKAVEYLTRLAEKAARAYAHEEAVRALQDAVGHVDRLPARDRDCRRLDIAVRQAESLTFLGRFQEILGLLGREHDRLAQLCDASLAGPYHFALGNTYSYLGDHDRAAEHAERAIAEAMKCDDRVTMGKTYVVLAQESSWSEEPATGIERGQRAVELLQPTGEQWWLGLAYWVIGINYIIIGDFERALAAEARTREIGETIGDPRLQSYAAWTTGWIHTLTGRHDAAIEAFNQALARSHDPVNTAIVLGHLGYAYLGNGDTSEAIRVLQRAVEDMGRFQFRRLQGRFMTFLAEAYLRNSDLARARELAIEGLQITRAAKYWYGAGWAEWLLGRIALAAGELVDASHHVGEALRIFESIGAAFMVGQTRLTVAELEHRQGNREVAAKQLRMARDQFVVLRIPKYIERAERLANELAVS